MSDNLRPQGWAPRIFHKGERVVMTKRAQRMFPCQRGQPTGVVVSEPRAYSRVLVLRDGIKTPATYYSGFFRRVRALAREAR